MIYCFDIDGTFCSVTPSDYPKAIPYPEVIARINELYDAGHTIYIYTARGSSTGKDWHEFTKEQLKSWNIKYHKLFMGKPGADIFVDDKSIHVSEFMQGKNIPEPPHQGDDSSDGKTDEG